MGSRKKWSGGFCSIVWFVSAAMICVSGGEGVKVGVVLDLSSSVGKMCKTSIQLALSDSNSTNTLFFKDAGDVVGVASAAMELLRDDGVEVILGPQTSAQATYLAEFGRKYKIPVISFTATSPSSLSPKQNPYFIRATQNDSAQVEAINAIIQEYGWREIVPIYEDTEFGHGFIPYLADALQKDGSQLVGRTVISPSATEAIISEELKRLKNMRKMMFLLHTTASVGSKVLIAAKKEGMMSEGYAWIVTDSLSSSLDPIEDFKALDAMQGIVGVRPYIPSTKKLKHFQARFNQRFPLSSASPNIFALQAYDTVWALGMAVEKMNSISATATGSVTRKTLIRDAIANTKLEGISGDFHLVDGELKRARFEVFNVVGEKERIIGRWNSSHPLILKQPIWPGDTAKAPLMNLRVGVPVKQGFLEFVNVNIKEPQKSIGFCIELFQSAVKELNIPIDFSFAPFVNGNGKSNGSYDDLLYQIPKNEVDAVVGDITILEDRSEFVDFTLPFTESGVSMLVSASHEKDNIWIFMRPFKWTLWLVSFVSFIFTGFVVWLLECRVNADFGGGPPQQQIGLIFWFSFSTLVFAHREKILNNLSRFLLIIWVFVVLILTQSYTANLSSMLTAQRLRPSFLDANMIRDKGYSVGYLNDSFVRGFLMTHFGFTETQLKSYGSPEQFKEALDSGTNNGGVAAIFDEIPYIKVFLQKYPSGFQMVGPIYRTGGFGFAFPRGSPLVAYFSRAILNVTEDKDKMDSIEQKYNLKQDVPPILHSNESALDVYRFGGLFIITAVATWSSLIMYLIQFLVTHWPDSDSDSPLPLTSKMVQMGNLFYNKHFHFRSSSLQTSRQSSRGHSVPDIPETYTPQIDNSTEQPHNLGVENEDQTEHNVQSMNTATN